MRAISYQQWQGRTMGSTRLRRLAYLAEIIVGGALAIALRHTAWPWVTTATILTTDYLWTCRAVGRAAP